MVSPKASGTSEQVAAAGRVLAIFPGALGDLICLVPALRALARRHPDETMELMAREELARFAVGRIGIARAHSIDRREVAALFAQDPDLAEASAVFRPFTRVYSFFAAADPRFRRALEAAAAPGAVSFHAFRPAGRGHVATGYLNELGERGAPPDAELDAHIDVLAGDIAEAGQALARLGLDKAHVALLFPGSGSAEKNWPAENFAALASALPPPLRALVVLGPAERAIESVLMPLLAARGIAWLGGQPLGTIAGLAHLAAGFVGNDSGVSHLAAASGAPGVAIFGPTDPDRWRPLGRARVVRASKLADLTPAELLAALKQILQVC
ncbi:MAG: glycosyltransferase family 9 protein [Candidatus Binataceae bacterium]|jgi:heptosyltransferase III